MAEESKKSTPEAPSAADEEVVVCDVPVPEKPTTAPDVAESEPELEKVEDTPKEEGESKITESASFKEESNKVDDLIDPEKKALDEFKVLIRGALEKREFTAPPPPKEDKKKAEEESKPAEKIEEPTKTEEPCDVQPAVVKTEPEVPVEEKAKEEKTPPPAVEETKAADPSETVVVKVESVVEEIKETIIHEVTASASASSPCEPAAAEDKPKDEVAAAEAEPEVAAAEAEPEAALPPEEVSIWGIPLLADEKSDVILLKFLRARDFKVKEAFSMLKNVVGWRKEFKIDELLEEEGIVEGLEKVVYVLGVDKEGHPVCYNALGEFQDKELYSKTFADSEKRAKFLKWYIQFLEKNIRKLDFTPDGTCTILQIIDLDNSPGLTLFKKEFRQSTNQALQLLQDNYPEFVAKQVFINVPWWYVAYNRMISPFFTQRTKSKFVFAGPTKTTETLFKYLAPEQVPVQYGGLSKDGEQEFTAADAVTEETVKPSCKHTIELPITEASTVVWELRVGGWDVSYGAEFVPSAEGGYTWIVQKPRKIGPADEQVIGCTFKIGEPGKVVLTLDNQTSKKKKVIYRSKFKASD